MTSAKKILVTAAMVVGVAAGAATPALADSHQPTPPTTGTATTLDSHQPVSPQDSHIS
ncbi:hypothetical protein ACIBL6_37485 [Streptomyces sp. NPDC050400]|uniref:hypothetical protein n=1 Tax=Streptomyces sp. NPDC050400 TaxID=3365610 RepID=UPI00378D71FD